MSLDKNGIFSVGKYTLFLEGHGHTTKKISLSGVGLRGRSPQCFLAKSVVVLALLPTAA